MKRGRHDSAYDEVRRDAGYTRPQFEFPDEQEEEATRQRVAKKHAEFKERMAALDAQEAQRTVELEARLAERSKEIGRRMIMREYERAGVRPPVGILVSLPLLIKLGWQLQGDVDGGKVLMRPEPKPKRKTRADYEAERAQEP
jgi:hypothetical protein